MSRKIRRKLTVTLLPSPPHTLHSLSRTFSLLYGRWSTSGPRWVTHISCHYKNTIGGTGENKTNEQTRTMLGVNSRAEGGLCNTFIPDSIYGLTLAWVTSENSTKQLECRLILTQSSSLDPIFSATVSGVDRICPWSHANSLPAPFSNPLSFVSPYHFRIRRDFRSKNPLSGFAPKQTKESSAWRATYIVLHYTWHMETLDICFNLIRSHRRIFLVMVVQFPIQFLYLKKKKKSWF